MSRNVFTNKGSK